MSKLLNHPLDPDGQGRGADNHPRLRQITRGFLAVPFAKPIARVTARFAIQTLPLAKRTKQRIYSLLAVDAASRSPVTCHIALPTGRRLLAQLDLSDDLSRNWYYWGYNNYEIGTVRLWDHLLKTSTTVFDVGANIGVYTLLAAARLQGRGAVHCFEPNAEVFSRLGRNVALNRFTNVHAAQLALSDFDGDAKFFIPKNNAWTNGSLIEGFTEQMEPMTIETTRFDTYCSKLDLAKVDLIKIDVEGSELNVLRGMGKLLRRWRPDIICEVLEGYAVTLNEFLSSFNYRKFLIKSDGLEETNCLYAHREFRDYYLSNAPVTRF
jgi:FkbM family methyltransferase